MPRQRSNNIQELCQNFNREINNIRKKYHNSNSGIEIYNNEVIDDDSIKEEYDTSSTNEDGNIFELEKKMDAIAENIVRIENEIASLNNKYSNLLEIRNTSLDYSIDESYIRQRNFQLSAFHNIGNVPYFKDSSLNNLYENFDCNTINIQRRIHSLIRFFLCGIMENPLYIWIYSASTKRIDGYFPFPNEVKQALIDCVLDSLNLLIPTDRSYDDFYMLLGDSEQERAALLLGIKNSRKAFKANLNRSIASMITYLREYHYDKKEKNLVSCKNKDCKTHLTWKSIKKIIEEKNFKNLDEILNEMDAALQFFMDI